jgi:hypothetical protein
MIRKKATPELGPRLLVMKQGKAFDVYVGQVDAFMALAEGEYGNNA